MIDIKAIRERCEAATPGPWESLFHPLDGFFIGREKTAGEKTLMFDYFAEVEAEEDADFISHARTDIPNLLAEVERITKERDAAVEDLKDSIYNPFGCAYCKHQRIDRDTFYCDLDCGDEHNKFEWIGLEAHHGTD